jgi:formamidopyrimidine-DNA glycosylase
LLEIFCEVSELPELPEVETTINELRPFVTGRKIIQAEVYTERTIAQPPAKEFSLWIAGQTIRSIMRRGKFLIFELDEGWSWIVHLRMTGSMLLKPSGPGEDKFLRVLITLDNQTAINFRDPRRFGRMWLVKDISKVVGKLGIEPLSVDFTPAMLTSFLKDKNTPVKSLLLDQTLIAGIGNMYADEALYQARIHPQRPSGSLTHSETARLHSAIQSVLHQGIENKGASTDTFFRPEGARGAAHLQFKVAHRKGEKCPRCSGVIERIVVGQRGTFYCPNCQKLKK